MAQLKPLAIIGIFGTEGELYNEFAVQCFRIYLLMIPTFGFQQVSIVFFQSTGHAAQASVLSICRQIVFQISATVILPLFFGITGALWANPVSDILTVVLTIILLLVYWKKIFTPEIKD